MSAWAAYFKSVEEVLGGQAVSPQLQKEAQPLKYNS